MAYEVQDGTLVNLYPLETLRDFTLTYMRGLGATEEEAKIISDGLMTASQWWHPGQGQGLEKLFRYTRRVKNGGIVPGAPMTWLADAPAYALLDAAKGFGYVAAQRAMRRAVELGDGWHPIGLTAQEMKEGRAYMAGLCERRNLDRVPAMSLRANLLIDRVSEPVGPYAGRAGNTPFKGDPSRIRDRVAEFEEAGVEHIVLDMATLSHPCFLRTIEPFAARVRG